jgi:hypothetical protein
MRYFYRLAEGPPPVEVMTALLHNQEKLTDTSMVGVQELVVRDIDPGSVFATDRAGAREFMILKLLALAIKQKISGALPPAVSVLGRVLLLRAAPKTNVPLGNVSLHYTGYVLALHAEPRTLLMAGDETVMVKSGDTWAVDMKQDAHLINNSDDDVVILLADVMVDS